MQVIDFWIKKGVLVYAAMTGVLDGMQIQVFMLFVLLFVLEFFCVCR